MAAARRIAQETIRSRPAPGPSAAGIGARPMVPERPDAPAGHAAAQWQPCKQAAPAEQRQGLPAGDA
jgi:hypothetical protein